MQIPTEAELREMLPKHKCDMEAAKKIVALGYPAVKPVLDEILVWMQDINWPVTLFHFLAFLRTIGMPLLPHLKKILATDDDWWKYWIIGEIIVENPQLMQELKADVKKFIEDCPGFFDEEVEDEILARC